MKRNSRNFFEDRFDRDYDSEISGENEPLVASNMEIQDQNKSPTELADICEICHKFTRNIYRHIKFSHPYVYQKMMEKFIN